MKKFIIRSILFLFPLLAIVLFLEKEANDNTYHAKSSWLKENMDSIEVVFFGSSHMWRAINPQYIEHTTASLAHGGSGMNLDFLLFDKYIHQMPELKCVVFEASPHSFFVRRNTTFSKNHLFNYYYGINNYGKQPPLKDRLLVTSNTKAYISRLIKKKKFTYNKWGFIDYAKHSRYSDAEFKVDRFEDSYDFINRFMAYDLQSEENMKKLEQKINYCKRNNIEVVLLSPPKAKVFNELIDDFLREGRNQLIEEYKAQEGVHLYMADTLYQENLKYFLNEDHMSPEGAMWFSKDMNEYLKEILS